MIQQSHLQFRFPSDEQAFRAVKDIEDLKVKILKARQLDNVGKNYFHISQPKINYLYAYCSSCSSKLKYKKDEEFYRLIRFSNFHEHKSNNSNQSQTILNYLTNLPLSISLTNKKALVKQEFGINDRRFYYLHHKIAHLTTDFYQLTKRLDDQRYESRFKPFPLQPKVIPDIFVTSSPTMKANYLKYGQFISVDVTYNLIKEKSNGIGWGVCLILGMNSHHHIIPFALAIMNNQSESSFSQLFLSFFEMMGRQPQTIISDQQISIKSSLSKLQQSGSWSGIHLLDKYHILKNLKKKLKQSTQVFNILKNAIIQKDKLRFQREVEKAYTLIESEFQARVIKEFIDKSEKFCLCNTPNTFFGISISTSFGQKANDILKSYLQFQRPAIQCMKEMIKVAKILELKALQYKLCKVNYEQIMGDDNIRMIRFQYCDKVFETFMKNYVQSLKLRAEPIDEGNWSITNEQKSIESIEVILRYQVFRCSCGLQIKQGIPCSHLLLLCRMFHIDYHRYFHDRWKIEIKLANQKNTRYLKQQNIKVRRGRPRFSRRNIL